jgi:hypothetical protein
VTDDFFAGLHSQIAKSKPQTIKKYNKISLFYKNTKDTAVKLCSSRFKIPKAEHGSATTWSGCSRAKPTAHTGSGIS